jgi:hypothetical protein
MDTRSEIKGIVVADERNEIREIELDEYVTEFSRIAEMAKYPPFSLPDNRKDSDFLVNLSKEYDLFASGEKPYNSFDDVLADYAEETNLALSWMSLGYSPIEAAFQYTKRNIPMSADATPENIDKTAKAIVEMSIATAALSEEEIVPWGFM